MTGRLHAAQVFGKFNIAGALRDQGVNACSIVEGRNADAQFPFAAYSRQQLRLVNHLVDHIYTGFIQKVAPCSLLCACQDACSGTATSSVRCRWRRAGA